MLPLPLTWLLKTKYNINDSYLEELNKTKKQLNDFVYGNWEVDSLINNRGNHMAGC